MAGIQSREQFEQVLGDAERLAQGLAARSEPKRQQLLQVLAAHLAYARATVAGGAVPTAEQKAAVDLASVVRQLAPGPNGENTDPHTAWLYATLPMLAAFYAAIGQPAAAAPAAPAAQAAEAKPADAHSSESAPTREFQWGDHVCVRWPSGQRYLGFVRFVHEQTFLVAFPNGMQQWLHSQQLEPAPAPGQPLVAMDAEGQQVRGTLTEFAAGRYQLDLGEGRNEWFEWTRVQPG